MSLSTSHRQIKQNKTIVFKRLAQDVSTKTQFGAKNTREDVKIENQFRKFVKRRVVFAIPINKIKVGKKVFCNRYCNEDER